MAWTYSRNYVYFERELIERAAKLANRGQKTKEECKFWHNDLADGDGWIRLSCARIPRIAVYAFSTGEYRDRENELSIVAIKGYSVYGVNSHKYGEFLTAIKPMLEDASKGYSHEELFDFEEFLRETIFAIALLIAYICEPGWNWEFFLRDRIKDLNDSEFPEILLTSYSIANTIYAIEKEAGNFAEYDRFTFSVLINSEHGTPIEIVHINDDAESWARNNIMRQIICDYEALKRKWELPFSENKGAQR